jgi:tetratricopeptide (TPR) repeat protein
MLATVNAAQPSPFRISNRFFIFLLMLLVGAAILRSAIATRLDDFTLDEAYHITAGASYVQRADFRLNPEHPPLVKLWVGALLSASGFHLEPFREFHDKFDERTFSEQNVFQQNDPDSVQRRSRIAMWTLNGLLLVGLALALRNSFGPFVSLGTILFLAIDPTVSANLPVVMTDLPVALLSATAVVLATRAFQCWAWPDLLYFSVALGLALSAKHSAPVFYIFLGIAGLALALRSGPSQAAKQHLLRLAKLCTALVAALAVLWGAYFFRYNESSSNTEVFNRPLAEKLADVNSPVYRFVLTGMSETHVVPRAYIWGFADVIRAGLEGRALSQLAFGHLYYAKAPWWFFPGVISVKLPVGLTLLIFFGVYLFFARRFPREWSLSLSIVFAATLWFLLVLSRGATYAGIRHALPAIPLLAIFAGCAMHLALSSKTIALKIIVGLGFLLAALSAIPVVRPWEYYNELIGGARDAHLYFDDEGLDVGQRSKELAQYYRQVVQPTGELPRIAYIGSEVTLRARGVDYVGQDPKRDESQMASPVWSGTILIASRFISRRLWWDMPPLRAAAPAVRFGNLLVFRGTFSLPTQSAAGLYFAATAKMFDAKPDYAAAERLFRQTVTLDPNVFFADIELGNLCMKRGSREDALRAYSAALEHAPNDRALRQSIQDQIKRVSVEPLDRIRALRDPGME